MVSKKLRGFRKLHVLDLSDCTEARCLKELRGGCEILDVFQHIGKEQLIRLVVAEKLEAQALERSLLNECDSGHLSRILQLTAVFFKEFLP